RDFHVTGVQTCALPILQTGLDPARLIELRNLRDGRPITVPLGAYLDLTAQGAVAERAWFTIMELARRQVSDREYERLDPAALVRSAERRGGQEGGSRWA